MFGKAVCLEVFPAATAVSANTVIRVPKRVRKRVVLVFILTPGAKLVSIESVIVGGYEDIGSPANSQPKLINVESLVGCITKIQIPTERLYARLPPTGCAS